MDPLSDIIALLRPHTAIAKPITGRGRWGVRYGAHDAPGFVIILKGRCWITFEGQAPLLAQQGDFLLLPTTPPFTFASHPDIACEWRLPAHSAVRHGEQEGAADFESLGGSFRIEPVNAALLLPLLPRMIHIPAAAGRTGRLSSIIELILAECSGDEPGREMLLQRLLEVLLIETLRGQFLGPDDPRSGLVHGLRDAGMARALRAMHGDVRANWTVAALAKLAGQSRSAFAAGFSDLFGCGPIEYLSRWRMALAKDALTRGIKTLDAIAAEIGYESASAFSTAFKRREGCPPGQFARQFGYG